MQFKDFVSEALKKNPELQRLLANEYQVPDSTVLRWANGIAKPHLQTQEVIRKFIAEHS